MIYTYSAGTMTPKATYTDQGGLTQMSNPIQLDDAGRATWWIDGSYKYIVKDSLGNPIATTDNVTSFQTLAAAADAFFQSFSGDGTTTAFTLSTTLGTEEKALLVFVSKNLEPCISNGNFATDTIWTKGAGWTIAAGVATATGAISTAISQTAILTLVAGQAYAVTYTITRSAGGLIPSIGGTSGVERTASGTYREIIIAGSTQVVAFTGNGFTGTLDDVSVTVSAAAGYDIQAPSLFTVNGTALTFATAPPIGTNNIYVFAPSSLVGAASASAALAAGYAAAAAASAAIIPTPTGNALKFIRVNAGETAYEVQTAPQVRTDLGLVIGTNVQAWDADLDIWATKTAPTGTVVGTDDSQTITNKTINVLDSAFALFDDGDNTKIAKFQASGITTGTTRTYTLPDVSDTLVALTPAQTLTNKTLVDPIISASGGVTTSNFSKTSDTTFANIPLLTVNVTAGGTYIFNAYLLVSEGGGGCKFAIGDTCTKTRMVAAGQILSTNAILANTRNTALNTNIVGVTAGSPFEAYITGQIVVADAGTLTVKFAQNASNGAASTVSANSFFNVTRIV